MRLLEYNDLPKDLKETNSYEDFFKAAKKGTSTIILYRQDMEKQTWKKHGSGWRLQGRRLNADEPENKELPMS